jgi:ribosomal protein S21
MTINVKITPKNRHESSDRMIRRFIKRTKKIKLMDELRERRHYVKPSEIKRNEKRRRIAENAKRVRQEKAILLEEANYSNRPKRKTRRK